MKLMTFWVTSFMEVTKSAAGLPFSPATRMPQPNAIATTMIWSMVEFRNGAIALFGKMLEITVIIPSGSFAWYSAPSARLSTGKEPLKRAAITRPITHAMAVVTRK